MKLKFIFVLCLISLSTVLECYAQSSLIYDSKFNKFSIGFKVHAYANTNVEVSIISFDSLTKIILFDSTVSEKQDLIFLNEGENFDSEKLNYIGSIVIPIPMTFESGVYFLNISYRSKFVWIN